MLQQIDWTQFTPLLIKAEQIKVKKSKIDAKGVVTEDPNNWVLAEVEWNFSPAKEPVSLMKIETVDEKGQPFEDSQDTLHEQFDFLSGAFKFYYNDETEQILGEIELTEGGFPVTYRYEIFFYGSQKVSAKDFMVSQSVCSKTGVKTLTNSVIAL